MIITKHGRFTIGDQVVIDDVDHIYIMSGQDADGFIYLTNKANDKSCVVHPDRIYPAPYSEPEYKVTITEAQAEALEEFCMFAEALIKSHGRESEIAYCLNIYLVDQFMENMLNELEDQKKA